MRDLARNPRREKLRAAGVCIECRESPARVGLVHCTACGEQLAKNAMLRHRRLKEQGLCVRCAVEKADEGRVLCFSCAVSRRIARLDISEEEKVIARQSVDSFDGRCQCCGKTEPGGKGEWHLDHCHETHTFRGIVCASCNLMLGFARNSVKILALGILYLKERKNGD